MRFSVPKTFLLIVAVAIALVFSAHFFQLTAASTVPRIPNTAGDMRSYTNPTYGYSVSFPSSMETNVLINSYVSVGVVSVGAFNEQADIAVMPLNAPQAPLDEETTLVAQLACSGGPLALHCPSVASSSSFMSASGASGKELWLNATDSSGIGAQQVRGPFFVFDISAPGGTPALLIIYPPSQLSSSQIHTALLQEIATSLTLR